MATNEINFVIQVTSCEFDKIEINLPNFYLDQKRDGITSVMNTTYKTYKTLLDILTRYVSLKSAYFNYPNYSRTQRKA